MPQFLIDWQQWWLDFWAAHPVVFWLATATGLGLVVLDHWLKRRNRPRR